MLTDEVKIEVAAGKGGDGIITFDKVKMSLGPTGGRGGNGGNVYFLGVSDIFALRKFMHKQKYWAEDGKKGRGNRSDGPNGKDLVLNVPIGTVIHNLDTQKDFEVTVAGEKYLAAEGGLGGRGNFYFRSPKNTSPRIAEKGKPGERFNCRLELRLIADIGLIGLPSAGKSSLLNELTAANVKVAAYHFTTLEPNLGDMDGIVIADIPGLIEDASKGKGLGVKFLRHIERTKALVHCLSLESDDLSRDYKIIRRELKSYNPKLLKKKELVLLTKSDLVSSEILKKVMRKLKLPGEILAVSIHDWSALKKLRAKIAGLLR